jgi:hydrocephalus-inducing protein
MVKVPSKDEEPPTTAIEEKMEECLISVHPSNGEIPPGEEQMISVKFTPSDVVNISYKFCCKMSHLKGSAKPLYILVQCSSIVPYCHFELPETDYISRRPFDTKGTYSNKVDQTTKVIEFTSIGTGNKIMRSFHIVNPTDLNYEFVWTPLEEGPLHVSPLFKCLTPKGQISGGKKYEVKFEYKPTNEEWVESHWNFTIPSLSLTVPFLLVGHMQDPNITFDRSYLNFKSLLIGSRSTETVYLINNEDKPYSFTIDENSCCSYNYKAKLIVFPLSGTIPPNDKFPVEISFTAVEEREFIFHLVCNLKKKVIPLTLNIKALGYAINMTLSYTDASDKEYSLSVDKNSKRIIDFGKVPINDRGLWKVAVHNSSQFGLHCRWILSDKCLKKGGAMDQLITISPKEELISAHHKGTIQLTYSPTNNQPLKNCLLTLQITNGPELPIALKGTGVEPHVVFSFMGYSFGPRFLHHPNMPPNITTLTITNKEDTNVTIECLYTSTTNIELLLDSSLVVLSPDETMDIDCYFRPYEAIKYSEDVIFEINGLCKKCINISGEGAVVKVEPSMKSVNLGSLLVREKSSKIVKLTNMSPLAVTFTVNILPSALVPALQEEGVLSVWFCLSKAQLAANVKEVTLKPKEVISVEVSFCPTVRVPHFSEEVIMESHGLSYPLFIVKGSCHGLDVSLDNNHIPFGAVVLCSKSVRRIQMVNNGDIGTRFEWKVDKFGPDFSISPAKGYLSTGMQIPFDVTFHPVKVHNDIRYDNLLCHIEKGPPLSLTLTGVCIEQTASKEVLHFATTVRNKETKQLTINNKTSTPWLLHPIIDGEYWSGPISLSVGSSQVGHYELTYTPLLMTQDTQKHQGSIFFPLPDGTGLLYNLLGTADAPKHSGSIVQEIPCKTSHVELLSVQNWLPQSQRFRAIIEMIRPEKLDRSVNMYGVEYIDVPARSKRDYKIHFYSYKEGSFLSKVTFLNEQSGEYQFFHVHFKSTPAGIIGTIELATSVRHSVSHTITLDNPFPTPINVNTSVNISDISIPTSFLIGAESQGKCTFEYLPLKVDELTGKMTLQCSELGTYQYELHLKATPPASEKPVHFTASLGSSQTLPCYFTSYAKGRTEYSCKIDSSDFHVDKSITVSTNEASIDVNFEPSCLGDTHAALMISSVTGGDYIIPLTGHCLVPKPQGPYTIKAGASITIPYRNAFHQTQTFSFFIDNPAFSCKASDNLKPRKLYNILVHFDAKQADPSLVKLGKLIVSCKGSAKTGGTLKWTYYLKGLALDK